jgi:hypothetical protein
VQFVNTTHLHVCDVKRAASLSLPYPITVLGASRRERKTRAIASPATFRIHLKRKKKKHA